MLKRHGYWLGLIWMLVIFVLPLPFLQTLQVGIGGIVGAEWLPIAAGTIAYVWMLTSIYISTRPQWLDRTIGLPAAYQLHGIISLAAILLAFLHLEGAHSQGWIKLTGFWAFYLFLGVAAYSLIFMAGWLTSRVHWLASLKVWLEKVFRHEISLWLHRLNLVATILVFIHVWLIDYIRAITPFMILFTGATGLVFLAYGYYRYQAHQGHTRARLMEIKALNDQVLQLVIKLRRPLSLHSGDYIFIAFPEIAGLEELHPFSLAKIDPDRRIVTLAIRQDGDFTSQLVQLSSGQSLIVTGGYGLYHSIIQDQKPQAMILLAGGIGVVPLLSIAEQYADLPINFYYNAHSANNLLYEDLFTKWEQRNNFKSVRQVGRLATQEVINHLPDDRQGLLVLIAGPSSMTHHWIKVLKAAGIPRHQIFYEAFNW